MSRVKLELPAAFPFSTRMHVRISDVNYGGHLGNDAVLGLLHEARVRYLSAYGMSEMDAGGPGLIMVDVVIAFRSEAFRGEELRIEVAPAKPSRTGVDLFYRITAQANGREIARAKTGMAFFDYRTRRIAPAPERFSRLLSSDPG
jgi:acyl-CoA thioester hydrolase